MKSQDPVQTGAVKGFVLRWFARGGALGMIAIAVVVALRAVFSSDPNLVLLSIGLLNAGLYFFGQATRAKKINDTTVQGLAEIAKAIGNPTSEDPAIAGVIEKLDAKSPIEFTDLR